MPRSDQRHPVAANAVGGRTAHYATVFIASFCVMVIEMVAGRMISGNLGASVYTWTSVIGVVLAGLSVGNYIGGRLADRFDARHTLVVLFVAASAASVSILILDNIAKGMSFLWMLSWPARVASHVTLAFFLPSCLLGMTSPVVAKMALSAGDPVGRTIGSVYAWGVVGSILGTFTTGFFLVEWYGTSNIILGVAVVLALLAVLYRARSLPAWSWMACLAGIVVLATGNNGFVRSWGESLGLRNSRASNSLYYKESQYSFIEVKQRKGDFDRRELHLDALLHSQIDMDLPLALHYQHEKIFAAVTRRLFADGQVVNSLMIGGGGYVYPRYMEETYPGSRNDVVEIDPEVTRAAMVAFGLQEDTSIRSFHEDARVYSNRLRQEKEDGKAVALYDMVYVDAFNHHSVPFQLTTIEFIGSIHSILKAEGALLINMIDAVKDSRFLGAMVNTVQEVFPVVHVLTEGNPPSSSEKGRTIFVVVAMNHPLDDVDLSSECGVTCEIFSLSEQGRAELAEKENIILTDDFAPVENLLAAVVQSHSLARAVDDWRRAIQAAVLAGDDEHAIALAREAVAVFPDSTDLVSDLIYTITKLAAALREAGEVEEALAMYREALKIDPDHLHASLGAIDCYSDLGKPEEALPLYDGILEFDPAVRFNYATALARLGQYPEAIEQFAKVTQESPEFADAYNNWGNTLLAMGDREGAAEKYEKALRVDPGHGGAGQNLERLRD